MNKEAYISENKSYRRKMTYHSYNKFALYRCCQKFYTNKLLADITLLSKAHAFIGTYSSNLGRFIALLRNKENSHSVDENWHPY